MEENKEKEKKVETEAESKKGSKILVKVLIIAIIVAVVVLVFLDILIRSPKEVAKSYINKGCSAKLDKAFDYVDLTGYSVIKAYLADGGDLDEYDDFWEDYQDALDNGDTEDYVEEFEENFNDEVDDNNEDIDENDYQYKFEKIRSVEKISDHFYRVKIVASYENEEEDEEGSGTASIYIVKKGVKSYVVYGNVAGYSLDTLVGWYSSSQYEDLNDSSDDDYYNSLYNYYNY